MIERVFSNGELVEEIIHPVTIEEVREETLRRLMVVFGARDAAHLAIKVQDAVIEAGGLTDKEVQGGKLTSEEQALATYLRAAQQLYRAIKAAGNAFEAQALAGQCPQDFTDDSNWPGAAP